MLPNLVIIGAMKSGTTSLHYYLKQHPEIFMSEPKELDFFVAQRNWPKGLDWYETHFPESTPIRGESSTFYSRCHLYSGVPERMHGVIPDARLIYVLRDPVERIPSQYRQRILMGNEQRSFMDALEDLSDDNVYLNDSRYFMQLEQYLAFYPKERILVLSFEELRDRRLETLKKAFRFLGVDDSFTSSAYTEIRNRSVDKLPRNWVGRQIRKIPFRRKVRRMLPAALHRWYSDVTSVPLPPEKHMVVTPELRLSLLARLQGDIVKLKAFTGRDFSEWPTLDQSATAPSGTTP